MVIVVNGISQYRSEVWARITLGCSVVVWVNSEVLLESIWRNWQRAMGWMSRTNSPQSSRLTIRAIDKGSTFDKGDLANSKFGCTAPSVAVKARCAGTYPTSGDPFPLRSLALTGALARKTVFI